ncbi:hypothetical protein ACS0TY_033633 [Phlomoides rotata]
MRELGEVFLQVEILLELRLMLTMRYKSRENWIGLMMKVPWPVIILKLSMQYSHQLILLCPK